MFDFAPSIGESRMPSIIGKRMALLFGFDSPNLESLILNERRMEVNALLNLTVVVADPSDAIGAAEATEVDIAIDITDDAIKWVIFIRAP
jgi:hypothetical protein